MQLFSQRLFYALFFILLSVETVATAQSAKEPQAQSLYSRLHVGIEANPLPFILKGLNANAWIGLKRTRLRVGHSRITVPTRFMETELSYKRLVANALFVDFYRLDDFKSFFIGIGVASWAEQFKLKMLPNETYSLNSIFFGFNGGYGFNLSKHFSLTLFTGFYLRLSNTQSRNYSGQNYKPDSIYPQMGLRLGVRF